MKKILYAIIIIANYLYIPWANALNDRQNRVREPIWQGVVTFVSDGDSVMVRPASGGAPVKIRINGVDAPEICQAYGPESRLALQSRVMGRTVTLDGQRRDDYGRVLARIYVIDGARANSASPSSPGKTGNGSIGDDVGQWMVRQGHAWSYRFRREAGPYAAEQSQARAARRGLFAGMRPGKPGPPGQLGQLGQSAQILEPREFRKRNGPCDRPNPASKR